MQPYHRTNPFRNWCDSKEIPELYSSQHCCYGDAPLFSSGRLTTMLVPAPILPVPLTGRDAAEAARAQLNVDAFRVGRGFSLTRLSGDVNRCRQQGMSSLDKLIVCAMGQNYMIASGRTISGRSAHRWDNLLANKSTASYHYYRQLTWHLRAY